VEATLFSEHGLFDHKPLPSTQSLSHVSTHALGPDQMHARVAGSLENFTVRFHESGVVGDSKSLKMSVACEPHSAAALAFHSLVVDDLALCLRVKREAVIFEQLDPWQVCNHKYTIYTHMYICVTCAFMYKQMLESERVVMCVLWCCVFL